MADIATNNHALWYRYYINKEFIIIVMFNAMSRKAQWTNDLILISKGEDNECRYPWTTWRIYLLSWTNKIMIAFLKHIDYTFEAVVTYDYIYVQPLVK